MNILIIGQTTLHWGRMEYGNIGNYYIIEPFIRELHRVFPNVNIKTTLQMSDDFCIREKVARLPMELYYSWDEEDYYDKCLYELGLAEIYNKTGVLNKSTPYINEVLSADLVIDFSGDIWGANADFLGENRFIIGLIKDRIAQLLGKKTAMLAGSPGPFSNTNSLNFAKLVYEDFDLVTNRESISTDLLNLEGFDLNKTYSLACPAFLFEPCGDDKMGAIYDKYGFLGSTKTIGFIICGWNLLQGPFDRWPLKDEELMLYVEEVERLINEKDFDVFLMSHSNGFNLLPYFKLKHGRDFPYAEKLYEIITKRNIVDTSKLHLQEDIFSTWETKAVIGKLEMLISGRIHGAVAGLSQSIPTVIVDYGHEPKAHKLRGFAEVANVADMVVDPANILELRNKIDYCINNLDEVKKKLEDRMIEVRKLAKENFNLLKSI